MDRQRTLCREHLSILSLLYNWCVKFPQNKSQCVNNQAKTAKFFLEQSSQHIPLGTPQSTTNVQAKHIFASKP